MSQKRSYSPYLSWNILPSQTFGIKTESIVHEGLRWANMVPPHSPQTRRGDWY